MSPRLQDEASILGLGGPRPARDHPPGDMALAIAVAATVLLSAGLSLRGFDPRERERPLGEELAPRDFVRIVPVLDSEAPLLALGGGTSTLPGARGRSRSKRSTPVAAKAAPAVAADRTGAAASSATLPLPMASPPLPPEGGAEATAPEVVEGVDAGAPESTPEPLGAEAGGPGVAGPGRPEGTAGGTETDPLRGRALDVYRARLIAWFSGRFRVSGSGLPQSTLTRLRAGATVQMADGRTVTGFTLASSGNAVFDAAARATLESARGQALPPPPESYPDLTQTQISLTFACKEGRCD